MGTAADRQGAETLRGQRKAGGRMVIAVGKRLGVQELLLLEKTPAGGSTRQNILPVRFVPLTRD